MCKSCSINVKGVPFWKKRVKQQMSLSPTCIFFPMTGTWDSALFSQSVSSFAQACLTLCNPMKSSMTGLPVHHQLLEFTQIIMMV